MKLSREERGGGVRMDGKGLRWFGVEGIVVEVEGLVVEGEEWGAQLTKLTTAFLFYVSMDHLFVVIIYTTNKHGQNISSHHNTTAQKQTSCSQEAKVINDS